MDELRVRNARRMYATARKKVEAAKYLCDTGYYNDSASRAYYAAFHAVSMLLFLHDQAYSRHGQLIGAFNRDFIATGKLSKELGKALGRLYDTRQTADYDVFDRASAEEADQGITDAKEIIAAIKSLLEKELAIAFDE